MHAMGGNSNSLQFREVDQNGARRLLDRPVDLAAVRIFQPRMCDLGGSEQTRNQNQQH